MTDGTEEIPPSAVVELRTVRRLVAEGRDGEARDRFGRWDYGLDDVPEQWRGEVMELLLELREISRDSQAALSARIDQLQAELRELRRLSG